jgi:adenosylcobinamide-GDP ribazoletransferase
MLDGLRLSVGTLTALPVPPPTRIDRQVAGRAMLAAPLAVAPLALLVVVLTWAGRGLGVPGLVTASLVLVALVLGTRAMHLDGLADTADGLSASYDRERALEVMRRGDVGPSGAAAIALVLVLDAASLATLAQSPSGPVLAGLAVLLSRHGLAWACAAGVPSARPEGLGATVAGSVGRWQLAVAAMAALTVAVGASAATGSPWWVGAGAWAACVLAAGALLLRTTRRLGGITGDVLGAAVEIGFAAALTAAAVLTS